MAQPSKAQIDYLKHLLKQVGAEEPDWTKLDGVEVSNLIDDLKKKRGKPVWYGNGQFSHWEKKADLPARVAARHILAGYFEIGTEVLYGKYKNHRGKVKGFGKDKWGNPTIIVEPVPKGRKQDKEFGLYRIWRADVKEKALAEQAEGEGKLATAQPLNQYRILLQDMATKDDWDSSPLPLEVIPNYMGINLVSVEAVRWTEQPDGQLVDLTIEFIPAAAERVAARHIATKNPYKNPGFLPPWLGDPVPDSVYPPWLQDDPEETRPIP